MTSKLCLKKNKQSCFLFVFSYKILYLAFCPKVSRTLFFIIGREEKKGEIMPCFVPFQNNLDLTVFVLRSVSVLDDEIIHSMKCFSFQAEDLGCVYSSLMKSIHGNLIVWYGAWIKRSEESRHMLNTTLLSALEDLSHLAVLIQHGFYSVYAGESKDGQLNARFSTGDTILLCGMVPASEDSSDLSYACMAILRSSFQKVQASTAIVCLQCRDRPLVAMLHVWKSLQACYTWLITADYRRTIPSGACSGFERGSHSHFNQFFETIHDFHGISRILLGFVQKRPYSSGVSGKGSDGVSSGEVGPVKRQGSERFHLSN